MFKGHTKIELTDVVSGEITTVEEDNMITNIVDEIFNAQFGPCAANPFLLLNNTGSQDDVWSVINNFYGGLYLFDSQIEEDANMLYPPAGIRLTGFAGDYTYLGNNFMSGSYNKSESGILESGNGFKHVWDFATNQGNGTISSVCLTSKTGGKMSCGSFPWSNDLVFDSSGNLFNFNILEHGDYQVMKWNDAQASSLSCLHFDANKNEYICLLESSEVNASGNVTNSNVKNTFIYKKGVTLAKVRLNINKVSFFDTPFSNSYNEDKIIKKQFIEMPEGLKSIIDSFLSSSLQKYISFGRFVDDENYIYVPIALKNTSDLYLKPNDKFYFWKINVNDFSSDYFEVTNTTGENILFSYVSQIFSQSCNTFFAGDYIVVSGFTTKKIYLINKNDNTDVNNLKFSDGSDVILAQAASALINYYYDYTNKKLYFSDFRSTDKKSYVVDLVTKETSYINSEIKYVFGNRGTSSCDIVRKVVGSIFLVNLYDTTTFKPCIMPTFLSTINNLSTQVVKTQAQTMKVTYTITKANNNEGGTV